MTRVCASFYTFLVLSDIHSQEITLVKILEKVKLDKIDGIIIAGDLTNFGTVNDLIHILEMIRSHIDSPIYFIRGNCDPPIKTEIQLEKCYWIEKEPINTEQFVIIGSSKRNLTHLSKIVKKYVKTNTPVLVITHYPPNGTALDREGLYRHKGVSTVNQFLEKNSNVFLHICGHAHKAQGSIQLNEATVVNPGSVTLGNYALLSIEHKSRDLRVQVDLKNIYEEH